MTIKTDTHQQAKQIVFNTFAGMSGTDNPATLEHLEFISDMLLQDGWLDADEIVSESNTDKRLVLSSRPSDLVA